MTNLLEDIKAFCADHSMAPTTFGGAALNDRPFICRLQKGRRVWPETEAKVRKFMAEYAASKGGCPKSEIVQNGQDKEESDG